MKKTILIVFGGFTALVVFALTWFTSVNNKLVSLEEGVKSQQAQVQNTYQRRYDLIPNLVNTVKGYAKHEATVLEQVTLARSQVGQVKLNTPADVQNYEKAQAGLSSALSRLMVVVEKYPDLKANQNFRDLQSQLEGTENRITVERMRFNESAQYYNTYLKKFPNSLVASLRNFKELAYFEAVTEAKTAPKVEF